MMFLLQYVLPVVCVGGLLGIFAYALYRDRFDALEARAKALGEAVDTLGSLAEVARKAALDETADPAYRRVAQVRYQNFVRAASIVASIPVDRL